MSDREWRVRFCTAMLGFAMMPVCLVLALYTHNEWMMLCWVLSGGGCLAITITNIVRIENAKPAGSSAINPAPTKFTGTYTWSSESSEEQRMAKAVLDGDMLTALPLADLLIERHLTQGTQHVPPDLTLDNLFTGWRRDVRNAVVATKCNSVQDLISHTGEQLLLMKCGIGPKCLLAIRQALRQHSLKLKGDR